MIDPISIIEAFLVAEHNRDWDTIAKHIDDNIEYQVVGSEKMIKGKIAYLENMNRIYRELLDWKFEIRNIAADHNTVFVEFDGQGHFTGEYKGKVYTDIQLRLPAVCIFTVNNGKIIREREYWDPVSFEKQLLSNSDSSIKN